MAVNPLSVPVIAPGGTPSAPEQARGGDDFASGFRLCAAAVAAGVVIGWVGCAFLSTNWLAVAFVISTSIAPAAWFYAHGRVLRARADAQGSLWVLHAREAELAKERAALVRVRGNTKASEECWATAVLKLEAALGDKECANETLATRLKSSEAVVREQTEKLAVIPQLESRIAALEAELEDYRERERIRTEWQTLPQGYDATSEDFAAAVAKAME